MNDSFLKPPNEKDLKEISLDEFKEEFMKMVAKDKKEEGSDENKDEA